MELPFDPEDPPAEPPEGSDRALWVLSYELFQAHEPNSDGMCVVEGCRSVNTLWPCHAYKVACAGLIAAVYGWRPTARFMAVPQTRRSRLSPLNTTWT